MTNYWIKDITRKEVITKTQIPNKSNFGLFACYFNLMDKKGLALQLNKDSEIEKEKLFVRNGFEYFVFEHDSLKELMILPNKNLTEYTNKIVSKIENCKNETDVLNLLIAEMN
ncbi:MAG: hypothetical protein LC105_10235 [Chitinophagales bacterium]|nr:hypothetical protein [Chitinophagales bacterium]